MPGNSENLEAMDSLNLPAQKANTKDAVDIVQDAKNKPLEERGKILNDLQDEKKIGMKANGKGQGERFYVDNTPPQPVIESHHNGKAKVSLIPGLNASLAEKYRNAVRTKLWTQIHAAYRDNPDLMRDDIEEEIERKVDDYMRRNGMLATAEQAETKQTEVKEDV